MSALLTVMFSSHLEIALKAARRCEHAAVWSRICSAPASPGPPHRPCCQQLPLALGGSARHRPQLAQLLRRVLPFRRACLALKDVPRLFGS